MTLKILLLALALILAGFSRLSAEGLSTQDIVIEPPAPSSYTEDRPLTPSLRKSKSPRATPALVMTDEPLENPWKSLEMAAKSVYLQNVPENPTAQGNPFAKHFPIYEKARETSQEISEALADQDWIQNKRSNNGSHSQKGQDTYVLPVSGSLLTI